MLPFGSQRVAVLVSSMVNIFSVFRPFTVDILQLRPPLQSPSVLLPNLRPHSFRSFSCAHRRCFHLSDCRNAWIKNQRMKGKDEAAEAQRKAQQRKKEEIGLRDGAIPYRLVQVASSGGLGPLRRLQDILREIDNANEAAGKVRFHIQLIANDPSPIVKMIDLKEDYERQKAARNKARLGASQNIQKEVQLSWNSSDADVDTKLEKAREDLERGHKVVMVMMPKGRIRLPDDNEKRQRVDDLVKHFQDVAKEWKEREFARTTAVIYLQGIAAPATDVTLPDKAAQKRLEKEKRRQKQAEKLQKKREREVAAGEESVHYISDHSTT